MRRREWPPHRLANANAELRESGRNDKAAGQLADGLNAFCTCIKIGEAGEILTQGGRDVPVTLRAGDEVEVADGRKQDGIANAVGQMVEAAELMGHRILPSLSSSRLP